MKIALVCPYDIAYPGGVTNHVVQFAQHARRLGHQAVIIAPSSSFRRHPGVIKAGLALPLPVNLGSVPRVAFSFWNFPKIQLLLIKEDFDVIHIHEPGVPMLGLFALMCAPEWKSAVVATFHTNTPYNLMTKAYQLFCDSIRLKEVAKKIDALIAVSETAKKFMFTYLPRRKCAVIPNGVDTERFSPDAKPFERFLDGKLNILFVGRLGENEKRKGMKYLVVAFARLHRKNPNTRLIVVGPGRPDEETREILSHSDSGAGIVFAGKASLEDLPRYYATADIFCSPAIHGESFGMVLTEAMAAGKPVVASNIDGYRDVMFWRQRSRKLRNGNLILAKAGILAEPRNASSLFSALEMLSASKNIRKKLGSAGRKLALREFSWKVVTKRVIEEYQNAIKHNHLRGAVEANDLLSWRTLETKWLRLLNAGRNGIFPSQKSPKVEG